MVDVVETLKERGGRYGDFDTHAEYSERLNLVFESSPNWKIMKADSKEALRIIANKIGRILNGDPEYNDNWHDIAGYAILVEQRINGEAEELERVYYAAQQTTVITPEEVIDDE